MVNSNQLIELNEQNVNELPYKGPPSRRIHVLVEKDGRIESEELFIQRTDAFTTNLVSLITRLKKQEISEIRYFSGYSDLIRIFLNEKGELAGEYFSSSVQALSDFKRRLGMTV